MKPINADKMDTTDLLVFCDAKQGGRVYMEDVISVYKHVPDDIESGRLRNNRDIKFYAVFDGHGGPEAAHFAKENLKNEILRQPGFWSDDEDDIVQAIKDGFTSTHQLMRKAIGNYYVYHVLFAQIDVVTEAVAAQERLWYQNSEILQQISL
jgi:serine/threonine protein phosphatase PrpC